MCVLEGHMTRVGMIHPRGETRSTEDVEFTHHNKANNKWHFAPWDSH